VKETPARQAKYMCCILRNTAIAYSTARRPFVVSIRYPIKVFFDDAVCFAGIFWDEQTKKQIREK
jgi:hypothetical protein